MYLHAYGKSGLRIATNTVTFATEFFPFGIKISGGVSTSFHCSSKRVSNWHFAKMFAKINKAIKIYILFLVIVSIWRYGAKL